MRTYRFMFPVLLAMTATGSLTAGPSDKGSSGIRFPEVNQVKIEDTFWKPKLNLWQKVTVNDVFDKFEGKHLEHPGEFCNTFENFDRVAKGERNIGRHAGAPWFDGLVYETIRGVADLMARQSDAALVKLYTLYRDNPGLKKQINVPVVEREYLRLAEFWIEGRGKHCGFPLWGTWGNPAAEQWIRDRKYEAPEFGNHTRPSWGDYAQDSIPFFEQKTIEGHAVRATLFATGATSAALENRSPEYIAAVSRLWDNMIGKRMFITGGVGAVHFDEKFGPDYFLPTDAYLETCAAVGAGFFSQRMNELTGDAKYMDELERTLYNNVLTGISLSGTQYTYQNPLNSAKHARWGWHDCPCCPPMFLKMMSAMPGFIYSQKGDDIYVNLFIGSETELSLSDQSRIRLTQKTGYPWDGSVVMTVEPEKEKTFLLKVRIPGWAQGVENPYDLYRSEVKSAVNLKVNGKSIAMKIFKGYAEIQRKWKKGDRVELTLPVQPRLVTANEAVADLQNKVAIAAGPFVYCLEGCDNEGVADLRLDTRAPLSMTFEKELLNGVNVIKGQALDKTGKKVSVSAIPYYALGNRQDKGYVVWMPANK